MPGSDHPEAPPPEVPEEFADAYREAYRRALESGDPVGDLPVVPAQEVVVVGTHRSDDASPRGRALTSWRASRWFLPALIGASALLLVLAAYGVGTALSDDDPGSARPSAVHSTRTGGPQSEPSHTSSTAPPGSWDGPVTDVSVDAISADCTARPSRDAAGHKVTYVPGNAIDGRAPTAWRCPGAAVGQRLTLRLGGEVEVGEVGLVPGYAKTDPESGVDRYAENNRITRVRWSLGHGVTVVQRLDPAVSSRDLQLLRVPRTATDTITLEILAVKHGPRNTTAISEVAVHAAD